MQRDFPSITREKLNTLQVNLGYRCNQICSHCHVNAGPNRKEEMSSDNINLLIQVVNKLDVQTLDLTGGAPELHPKFLFLIKEAVKQNIEIIDRCNLTILEEPGMENLHYFLADNNVTIVASLPCYLEENVDQQRGKGVFQKSISALKKLNKIGYGISDKQLKLNLVYNPIGISLPPEQVELEKKYKIYLFEKYGITFNQLYTITNMPIARFANELKRKGDFYNYTEKLINSFNSMNLNNVMCKNLISINWEGHLFDCDFNQQLDLPLTGKKLHLRDMLCHNFNLRNKEIRVGSHCFGCTAGSGSSCAGSLQ